MARGGGEDIAYYTLPVILSFDGVEQQINKSLGDKLGLAGRKGGQQFGRQAAAGIKSTQSDVDAATKSYEKFRDKAADALDKVTVEEKKLAKARQGGKEDQIAAAEARLAKARRDSVRASKDAESSHKSLADVQKRLGDQSDNTGGRFEKLSQLSGRLGTAIAGAATAAATVGVAGLAAVGATAIKVTRELYDLGTQFDDISDNIRVKTGATGAALDGLNDSVKNIGRTVPVGLGQLGDIVADTNTALRITGPELEAVSGAIANLGRLTGENIDIRELGKGFRGFGVEAKDMVPALDSLFRAGQNLGIGFNELVGSVVKGGSALRQFGLSFGESAALAAAFEEAGLDVTRSMAGLTRGLSALADKGKTGREALSETIGHVQQLIKAGDEAGAQDLANKLFGTRGGVQFFEAIKTGALDLEALASAVDGTGDTIADAARDTADWEERWQLLKNQALSALEPLGTRVFEGLNEKLEDLANWVEENQDRIIDFFIGVGDVAIGAADSVHGFVASTVRDMGLILEAVRQPVAWLEKVAGWLGKFNQGILAPDGLDMRDLSGQTGLEEFNENLRVTAERLQGAGDTIDDQRKIWDDVKKKWREIGDEAKETGKKTEDLADTTKTAAADIRSTMSALARDAQDWWGPALSGVPGAPLVPGSGVPGNNPLLDGPEAAGVPLPGEFRAPSGTGGGSIGPDGRPVPGRAPVIGVPSSAVPEQKPYGLPRGTDIRQGQSGFPDWVYKTGEAFGTEASTYSGHQEGRGVNQGIDWWPKGNAQMHPGKTGYSPEEVARMDAFAEWLGKQPGVEQVIWENPVTGQKIGFANGQRVGPGTSQPGYYANDWKDHRGHIHTRHSRGIRPAGSSGQKVVKSSGLTSLLPDMPAAPADSKVVGPMSPDLVNAFGTGYEPGIGTPGYDEYGEPGYYKTDPRQIAQADRRVQDTQQAIIDADQRILDAKEQRAEIEEDFLLSDQERAEKLAKIDRDIARAEQQAARSREDAQWAQEDAEEARRGSFSRAREAKKDKQQKGSDGKGLGDLGSIAGSFLKETLGIDGSFLPDLSSLMPVQMAGAALNAFAGPLQGLIDGNLGIQQPGWQPGMPVDAMSGTTSPSAFGLPDVVPPPMPPAGVHGSTGGAQPGPTVIQHNDVSTTVQGSIGMDPDAFAKQQQRNQDRGLARLTGFPGGLR